MAKNPCNEFDISTHLLEQLQSRAEVLNHGIIIPHISLSNRDQPDIDNEGQFYFFISDLVEGGDVLDHIQDRSLARNNRKALFVRMVKSVHSSHLFNVFPSWVEHGKPSRECISNRLRSGSCCRRRNRTN